MSEAGVNSPAEPPRVLLLVPARSYRATDLLTAAGRMGLDLVVGSDGALPLGGHPVVHVSPGDLPGSVSRIMALGKRFNAVVAADTPIDEAFRMLLRGDTAIVVLDGGTPIGMVTRADLLEFVAHPRG